ncbi:MAG: hypothetical protein IT454_04955 [Planctomycetes bacterium]|nr:hypothetical protein [Planctomycetota bacterium]
MKTNLLFASLAAAAALCSSCATGRVMSNDEPSMVGATNAGSEVYDAAVRSVLQKVLDEHTQKFLHNAAGKWNVAFIGVENKSAEELGDFEEAIYSNIQDVLSNSELYTPIDRRYVTAALNANRLTPDQLFLEVPRQQFRSVIGKNGKTPDILLFAKTTSQTTRGSKDILGRQESERTYQLQLDFVSAETGEQLTTKKSEPIRKQYTK